MIRRTLHARLQQLARDYRAIFLTGPRQSGKTTLARAAFPDFAYVSLEDLQNREDARTDPRGFVRRLSTGGAILDEVHNAPDLFSYLQGLIDEKKGGPYVLTGSQQFLLSERIGQSLAGRVAILELLPFSVAELAARPARAPETLGQLIENLAPPEGFDLDALLFSGLFPRIHDARLDPATWLEGYVRTYVERDVRSLTNVGDLDSFVRFVRLAAGRTGQILNLSSLGADAGVSHTTAKRWMSVLQASYLVHLLPPHHENFSKRLVKSPKIHFVDSGLLCHLLGIRKPDHLLAHPLRGSVFESFVVSEVLKAFLHHGERPPLFFWRDRGGIEIDLLADLGIRKIPIEVKAGETVASDAFKGLDAYVRLSGDAGGVLVHGGSTSYPRGAHEVRAWHACS